MAFVLVQHLAPDHETLLPELLSNYTNMPVRQIEDGISIEADIVYFVRPNTVMTVEKCSFRVRALAGTDDRMLIDRFFRSAAMDQARNVVGIVLSGTGNDGTLGLREIKQHGGMTVAQSPETSKYPAMPRSAILSGMVDHVLAVEDMPARIIEYAHHLQVAHDQDLDGDDAGVVANLGEIVSILYEQTGHDFSRYKQSTLLRRVQRRMQVLYFDQVEKYIAALRTDEAEAENLFKDLLIGVTEFFRDPDAFQAVAQIVMPEIVRDKNSEAQIRIWVPGCASGEEAYSLGMLMAEQTASLTNPPTVQIFATDMDAEALEFARRGIFSEAAVEHLSPARLERFFLRQRSGYEVNDALRSMCVFSPHDLIKDPPFSRLDLISCRNLLIYFEAELQKKLLPLFHYALNPSGFLFLGPAESVASRSELFRTVDKKNRIFQRQPTVLRNASVPLIDPGRPVRPLVPIAPTPLLNTRDAGLARAIERVVLEDFAPASVIINEQGDVSYFSGRTGKYLEPSVGVPTNKLVAMARKNLRLELRSTIHRAISTGSEVVRENLLIKTPEKLEQINLIVRPLHELGKDAGLFIVIFQELPVPRDIPPMRPIELDGSHPVIQQLETELRTTREDLQTTIEELETSNEELKSANEELLSMNEELQSTNEEMQTSREELQSLNDELQGKLEELDNANADLQNLFQSTQVATVFLDEQLRLKRFTPAMASIFRMSERDLGREIALIAPEFRNHGLLADVEEVSRTLEERQRQLNLGASWYIVRTLPYQMANLEAHGVVITFVDFTEQKRTEIEQARLAAIVESSDDAIVSKNLHGTILTWNAGAERLFGYTAAEAVGQSITMLIPADRPDEEPGILSRIRRGERIHDYETVRRRKDGSFVDVRLSVSPLRDSSGRIVGASKIARDITEHKRAQQLRENLAAIVESSDDAIISKNLKGIILSWNAGAERLYGYTAAEAIGNPVTMLIPPDRPDEEPSILERIGRGEPIEHYETTRRRKDGKLIDVSLTVSPLRDNQGRVIGASKIARDITERKLAQERLRQGMATIEQLNEIAKAVATELDLPKVVQIITDAGTRIVRAQFGAFFYNVLDEHGGSYMLYTLSGVPKETFANFPMPRATSLFGPTFRGEGAVRIDDVRKDPRFGKNSPHHGMPSGHLPVVSYLAVPVLSRTGQVLGGLFFGHAEPGVFSERDEQVLQGLAAHASAAMETARLYQAEQKARAAAELANQTKDDFLAALSHELRTPLTPVLAILSNLQEETALPVQVVADIETARRNIELEARLIDDLLDLTRITRGKLELQHEHVLVTSLIENAIKTCEPDLQEKRLNLVREFIADEPAVFVDSTRITQALWNLLKNAVKFTPQGGSITVRTRVVYDGSKNCMLVETQDTGIGLKPDQLSRIFDAFEQGARDITRQFGGLGLGLAISKGIVVAHGGKIVAHSAGPNQGSTFQIFLPLASSSGPNRPATLPRTETNDPRTHAVPGKTARLLLVEDHKDTSTILQRILKREGYEVIVANSMQHALQAVETAIRDAPIDLVISDLGLPDGSGLQLMRTLSAKHGLRGIALSGFGMEADVEQSAAAGFARHLTKPVYPGFLRQTISELLGRKS